jgi:hypothetical protein
MRDTAQSAERLHPASAILYLASMRLSSLHFECVLASMLLLTACGGRSMNKDLARDLIIDIPGEDLEKKDIEVVSVTQVSGSEAIAQTTLKTAFRLERVRGTWVVREVRIGHGQWEKVSNLLESLNKVKKEETGEMLDRISEAVRKYREANGPVPEFKDYVGLSDLLSPKYLDPLIRLDAWRRPFWAGRTQANALVIRSAGPDGHYFTEDDISRTIP